MSTENTVVIYVISDSVGETGNNLAHAAMAQFPLIDFDVQRYPLTKTISLLTGIMNRALREQAIIIHTFVDTELSDYINTFCRENDLMSMDAMTMLIEMISEKTQSAPLNKPGLNHDLNKQYFNRIKAIEFAVQYDDCKDPSGFLKADIVILGVSRTSKTPLSLYLANMGYKVANLPLVPKTQIPDEIYQIDKRKIIGLTNDPQILNNIRRERLISYGLEPDSDYSNMDNIKEELKNARELYKELDCFVIDVAKKSIEETAALILESLDFSE